MKQRYYQRKPKFNDVYSRNNLTKIKDEAYAINLHKHANMGTHWVTNYVRNYIATYFDCFEVEHIPKEIKKKFIGNEIINANIYITQEYDS